MTRHHVVTLLLLVCLVQTVQVGRQGLRVWRQWQDVRGLSNPERRLLLWGDFYREILRIESQIPKNAIVRWESTEFPWYSAYYLYPRLLTPPTARPAKGFWTLRYKANPKNRQMEAVKP